MTNQTKTASQWSPTERIAYHIAARWIGSLVSMADGLVGFLTLGFYLPGWSFKWCCTTVQWQISWRRRQTLKKASQCTGAPCTCTNGIGCVNVPVEEW